MRLCSYAAVAFSGLLAHNSLAAQNIPRFCVELSPVCRGTAVTHFTIGLRSHGVETAYMVGFDGALMRNFARGAAGLGAYWSFQSRGHRWGIKPRVRGWITPRIAADISAGWVLNSGEDRFDADYPGYVVQLDVSMDGIHGVFGRYEYLESTDGRSASDIMFGAQIGGKAGATGGLVVMVLAAFIESLKDGSGIGLR